MARTVLAVVLLAFSGCGGRSPDDIKPQTGASKVPGDMPDLFDVSEKLATKERSGGLGSLTPAEQTFHLVWWFEAELNNGGFDQFFFNSTGNNAAQTIAALETIGASKCARIVQRACALFPNSMPSQDRDARQNELFSITDDNEEAFEKLDAEFYQYPDPIGPLLETFWAEHGG